MDKRARACVLAILLAQASLAWGGEILETVSKVPSDLKTPLGPQSRKNVEKRTTIACYDFRSGTAQDCDYDFEKIELVQPDTDVANNGGHTHDEATHPVGDLRVIAPIPGFPDLFLSGQTSFGVVVISHKIPDVSGKIKSVLNLRVPRVPPGWRTISPPSCDATQTSWCFNTTVDVGVPGLSSLPDGSPFYIKFRNPPSPKFDSAHTNAVAFSGTPDTLFYLGAIAEKYNQLSNNRLSINDMSLPKGGLFDWQASPELQKLFNIPAPQIYKQPHEFHRTGQSADINKTQGDCRNNLDLYIAVNVIMPAEGSFFEGRKFPSAGRFLCETKNKNNIHIDFDVDPPPPPSPFQ